MTRDQLEVFTILTQCGRRVRGERNGASLPNPTSLISRLLDCRLFFRDGELLDFLLVEPGGSEGLFAKVADLTESCLLDRISGLEAGMSKEFIALSGS
jgi:hypothetical protein